MIEKLKALEVAATPRPWSEGAYGGYALSYPWDRLVVFETNYGDTPVHSEEHRANLVLCEAFRNLAPELIALWEAVPRVLGDHLKCPDCRCDWMPVGPARDDLAKAYSALNAKAAEVLK